MTDKKKLSASLEDYLETIFHIVSEKQAARARDIAMRLKVNNSSVTGALRSLSEKGYINYAPYDLITLTKSGEVKAQDVVRRHEALKDFFVIILGVDEVEAEHTACEMEHSVSSEVIERMINFVDYSDVCPRVGRDIARKLGTRCNAQDIPYENCEECIGECMADLSKKKAESGFGLKREILLSQAKPDQKVKVMRIKGRGESQKNVVRIGVKPGIVLKLEGRGVEDGSVAIKLKGYHVILSGHEASKVIVQLF